MLNLFKKTIDNKVSPENEQLKKSILDKIKFAVKIGDPFLIEKGYAPEYIAAGGKEEDIRDYIKQARINEKKKPKWDLSQAHCPYCKKYLR